MSDYTWHPSAPVFDTDGACVGATDWRGNRFRVGDKVMYCIGAGRGQVMAIGEVLQMEHKTVKWGDRTRDEFRVQVLTEATSGSWGNEKRTRPAWVNEMNITAIP